jgi:transcriptional regulator with XRE-family HTH domain
MCTNKSQPHLKDLKMIAEILDVDLRELLIPTKNDYLSYPSSESYLTLFQESKN